LNYTLSNAKRYCRCGAGEEDGPGTCVTPGFKVISEDEIEEDVKRNIKFLKLKRTENRMKNTSMCMLQSWRANCDVSLLIYDQDPTKLNFRDIAQVTGYIVAYCSKGNASFSREREVLSEVCNSFEGGVSSIPSIDTTSLIKKVLNRMSNSRIISKAEVSSLLLDLPLYKCTESFRHVPITPFVNIVEKNKQQNSNYVNVIQKYMNRTLQDKDFSLHEFTVKIEENERLKNLQDNTNKSIQMDHLMLPYRMKKRVVHATGLNGFPVFPVTYSYAKSTLIMYKPWSKLDPLKFVCGQSSIIDEFLQFLGEDSTPISVKLQYQIARESHYRRNANRDPDDSHENKIIENGTDIPEEIQDLLNAANTFYDHQNLDQLDRGLSYDFTKIYDGFDHELSGASDMKCIIEEALENSLYNVDVPTVNGKKMNIQMVDSDEVQSKIIYSVFQKLKEWVEIRRNDERHASLTVSTIFLAFHGFFREYSLKNLVLEIRTIIHDRSGCRRNWEIIYNKYDPHDNDVYVSKPWYIYCKCSGWCSSLQY
jgi:hypothetical protein